MVEQEHGLKGFARIFLLKKIPQLNGWQIAVKSPQA